VLQYSCSDIFRGSKGSLIEYRKLTIYSEGLPKIKRISQLFSHLELYKMFNFNKKILGRLCHCISKFLLNLPDPDVAICAFVRRLLLQLRVEAQWRRGRNRIFATISNVQYWSPSWSFLYLLKGILPSCRKCLGVKYFLEVSLWSLLLWKKQNVQNRQCNAVNVLSGCGLVLLD